MQKLTPKNVLFGQKNLVRGGKHGVKGLEDSRLRPKKLSMNMKIKYVICSCPSYVSNFSQFSTLQFCLLHIVFFVDLFFALDIYIWVFNFQGYKFES